MTLFFSLLHFFLSLLLNISSPSSFPFATSLSFDLAETWADRWTTSTGKEDLGAFKLTAGKYYNDEAADAGLQTSEDAKFYGSLTGFDTFGTEGKTLFVQVRANDAACARRFSRVPHFWGVLSMCLAYPACHTLLV